MPQAPRRPSRKHRRPNRDRRPYSADASPIPSRRKRIECHAHDRERLYHESFQQLPLAIENGIGAQANLLTSTSKLSRCDGAAVSSHPPEFRHRGDITDDKAALYMEACLFNNTRRQRSDSLASRILRSLIMRRTPLDDTALYTLLYAANKVFFAGTICGVDWRWSTKQELRFYTELLGTTCTAIPQDSLALNWRGGSAQPTLLIILSSPLLAPGRYDRNLLLSAFLHELIHCYLFVTCGLEHAEMCDGHTQGFHRIAGAIEDWIGDDRLKLGNVRARLEDFKVQDDLCHELEI